MSSEPWEALETMSGEEEVLATTSGKEEVLGTNEKLSEECVGGGVAVRGETSHSVRGVD